MLWKGVCTIRSSLYLDIEDSDRVLKFRTVQYPVRPNGTGFLNSCLPKAELARASRG